MVCACSLSWEPFTRRFIWFFVVVFFWRSVWLFLLLVVSRAQHVSGKNSCHIIIFYGFPCFRVVDFGLIYSCDSHSLLVKVMFGRFFNVPVVRHVQVCALKTLVSSEIPIFSPEKSSLHKLLTFAFWLRMAWNRFIGSKAKTHHNRLSAEESLTRTRTSNHRNNAHLFC